MMQKLLVGFLVVFAMCFFATTAFAGDKSTFECSLLTALEAEMEDGNKNVEDTSFTKISLELEGELTR
ncbi:MAG TPA: hypothetical protein ENI70_01450, partial [Candidatus Peregrinibacteria bacterium]|nr:hypothetical protein [Candidatus Peregrinibacteria bacterium]